MKKNTFLTAILLLTALLSTNPFLSAQQAVLHYTFDDVITNNGADGAAGNLSIVGVGTAAYETGNIGTKAYTGNGVDNHLSTNWEGITGNAARTITAWVKIPALDEKRNIITLGSRPSSDNKGKRFSVLVTGSTGSNQVVLSIQGKTIKHPTIFDTDPGDLNKWIFVAVTHDGSDYLTGSEVYVDEGSGLVPSGATKDATQVINTVNYTSGAKTPVLSGWASNTDGTGVIIEPANISLDDLRVYDYALSPAQIATVQSGGTLNNNDISFGPNELTAYPNVVTNVLNISTSIKEKLNTNVYDMLGQMVIRSYVNKVNMSDLASGLYIVKVRAGSKVASLKILKK